ncbi:MAG: type II toxin-antitoxin system HicA family toxin [Deltaproteobacteria bacterium]|nr:type II toxin-antitoxin system HicA family toxin [Deltaproteobacteria bacterium]
MKVDGRQAEKSLQNKGFQRDASHDHVYFFHRFKGKETGIKNYVSHSAKYTDIGPDNLKSMMRQLRLQTLQQVRDLLECPMTEDDYNGFLRRLGLLMPDD